jgi:hypothetical protein
MKNLLTLAIIAVFSFMGTSANAQCLPTYGNQCTSGDYIDNLYFNTISNLATGCASPSANNYTDYSATISTTVDMNQTYAMTCEPGPTWGQYYIALIDLNQNNDFSDAGEFFDIGYAPGAGSISNNITIPPTAFPGTTVLRVMCRFGTAPLTQADICSATLDFGEVEDYELIINPAAPDDAALTAVVAPLTGCGLTNAEIVEVEVSNFGTNAITGFDVCYSINAGLPVCETVSAVNIPNLGTYIHTFAATADLSAVGAYTFDAWVVLAGDGFNGNDTLYNYTIDNIPVVNTFPYTEDFEAGNGGWLSAGTNSSWQWGIVAGAFINAANSGINAYVTNLTGLYQDNEMSYVESPCFDFSALALDPQLRFAAIHTTPTFNVDGTWIEFSSDGGNTWNKLGTSVSPSGQNWYNNATNEWWDEPSGAPGDWFTAAHSLVGLAGQGSVRLRFAFQSDAFTTDEGFGFDDVMILPNVLDAAVTVIDSPATGCGLSNAEPVHVEITNYGTDTIFSVDVCYTVNAGPPVCETINDTILPNGTYSYTFSATADLTATGNYDFVSYTNLAGEMFSGNDTSWYSMTHVPIGTFPYYEDFEGTDGGWTVEGTLPTWQHGAPNDGVFITNTSACGGGNDAWVTNLTGLYNNSEFSYLISPCFDLSSATVDPLLRFDHIFNGEACCDESWVEVSIDGGNSWTKVGLFGQGLNWYNDGGFQWWDGTSGNPGEWRVAQHTLDGTAGESDVRVRFIFSSDGSVQSDGFGVDNIYVSDQIEDAQATAINGPAAGCGLTAAEVVTGTFVNWGADTLFNVPVCYTVNAGAPVCETIDTLVPGIPTNYSFTATVDMSATGDYNLVGYPSLTNDANVCEDTAFSITTNKPFVVSYPYLETFENGTGGWSSSGTLNTWDFGTPAKTVITGAASGVNAWTTGGLGTGFYNNNEQSFVQGPCFDFTNLPAEPWVALKVWWNAEFSWDGAVLQLSADSGATWQNVGNYLDPNNWYTDNSINGVPGGSQEGWSGRASSGNGSGGWVQAKHPIDTAGLIGQPYVLMRVAFGADGSVPDEGFAFDDIAIGELPNVDLGNDTVACASYVIDPGLVGDFEWYYQDVNTLVSTLVSNAPSITVVNQTAVDTTMNIILVYTDTLGLCVSDTMMGTFHPAPYTQLGMDTTLCDGDMLTLWADTAANHAYAWSTGPTTGSITVNGAGLYSVLVTNTTTLCQHSDDINITVPALVDLPATDSYCAGDSVMIDANIVGSSFVWSTTETTQSIYVNAPGTYYVDVTDTAFGCFSTDTVVVTENANPSVSLGADDIICDFQSITLDAGAGFSYLWSDASTNQTLLVDGAALGQGTYTYIATITDGNGCTDTDTITITVNTCIGISEVIGGGQVSVYPNPSEGLLNLEVFGSVRKELNVAVLNAHGQIIYTEMIKAPSNYKGTIDLTHLARGMYFIRFQVAEEVKMQKIVIH